MLHIFCSESINKTKTRRLYFIKIFIKLCYVNIYKASIARIDSESGYRSDKNNIPTPSNYHNFTNYKVNRIHFCIIGDLLQLLAVFEPMSGDTTLRTCTNLIFAPMPDASVQVGWRVASDIFHSILKYKNINFSLGVEY